VSRLPVPGQDDGTWGDILNDYLSQSLNSDGSLKSSSVATAGAETTTNKGQPSGYAPLDNTGKVPSANLPTSSSGVTSVTAADATITVGGTGSAPTIKVGSIPESDVTSLTSDLAATEKTVNKGAASGYASLDSGGHLPTGQLPSGVVTGSSFPPGMAFYDVMGHSIPGGGGVVNGDWNGYVDKLMFMLGSPRRKRNLAVGGAVGCWPSNKNQTGDGGWGHIVQYFVPPSTGSGNGTTGNGIYLPQSDVSVAHVGLNDLASLGSSNLTPFQTALTAIIGRMVAASLAQITDSSWVFSGAWTTGNIGGYSSPAGFKLTSTVGNTATWSIPSDYPGNRTVGINLLVNPAHDLTIGVTIDGVAQSNVRLQGSALCDPNGYAETGTGQFNITCLRYSISSSGAHTVVLTLSSQSIAGSTLYVDSAHVESDPNDGPIVVVPNPHRVLSYSYWGSSYWANGSGMSDSAVAACQTAVQSVVSNFGHTLYVDIDSAINKTPTYYYTDGVHPNDAGHGVIAKTIFDALLASGKLTSRQFSRVSPLLNGPYWIPVGASINGYPAFQNSWVNYGAPYASCSYYKDPSGWVHVKGVVKNGSSASATIFTLPPGYCPAQARLFSGGASAVQQIQVTSGGVVNSPNGGSTAATVLDFSFVAEQ
jgi:hypothetical protein